MEMEFNSKVGKVAISRCHRKDRAGTFRSTVGGIDGLNQYLQARAKVLCLSRRELSLDFDAIAWLSKPVELHSSISQQSVPILVLAFGEEILDEAIVHRQDLLGPVPASKIKRREHG
jgi:hypothetical protein